MGIKTTMERITPEIAQEILSHNCPHQRRLSKTRVDAYAHDMMSGDWQSNGETIKIAENGLLLDGQHRLAAIISCGKTIWLNVCRGIPNDSFMTIDVGQARTTRQIINMKNVDRDDILSRKNVAGISVALLKMAAGARAPTKPMIIECIESNREMFEWYYDSINNAAEVSVPYATLAIIAHLFGARDADIDGFIRGAARNDFDPEKPVHAFKHCVKAEEVRKATRSHHPESLINTLSRYFHSYANNNVNLTTKDHIYEIAMDTKYKVIKKEDENAT